MKRHITKVARVEVELENLWVYLAGHADLEVADRFLASVERRAAPTGRRSAASLPGTDRAASRLASTNSRATPVKRTSTGSAHPPAEAIVAQAKSRDLPPAEVRFDYGAHEGKVSLLKPLVGKSGWLTLSLFTVESLDQAEDHLIFAASTDGGQVLDEEAARRLLTLSGRISESRSSRREEADSSSFGERQSLVNSAAAGCLKSTRIEDGLRINFGSDKFEIKKYALSQSSPQSVGSRVASWVLPISAFFVFFCG